MSGATAATNSEGSYAKFQSTPRLYLRSNANPITLGCSTDYAGRLTMGCKNGMLPSSGKVDAVNDTYTRSSLGLGCVEPLVPVHAGEGPNMPTERHYE
ncbi:hypothetical protein WG66_017071 [Moniliophthora roreri]|nr:hypothetical protein WG66_017071 [Moniliophthora roreri]